ncbi:hypothetical protein BC2230_40776 [Burkholderia cepacia]|uniref:hypothetical protein n=1 Tax=Burkholderia cepacia TaxID=292 RepID=UPI0039A6BEEE
MKTCRGGLRGNGLPLRVFAIERAFFMFHTRNNVPLMEWSIGASSAVSKIIFSGRMEFVPVPGCGARRPKKGRKCPLHNKELHLARQAEVTADPMVGVFPKACSFLFYS